LQRIVKKFFTPTTLLSDIQLKGLLVSQAGDRLHSFVTPNLFQRQTFLMIFKRVKADATTFFHLAAFAQMPTKRSRQQDMIPFTNLG
jgi:hypothetical protein